MLTSRRRIQAGLLNGALFASLLIVASTRSAAAQQAVTTRDGWVAGALIGRIEIDDIPDAQATAVGVGATRFTPRRPGLDLAVVTIPTLFRDGGIPLHAQVGVALPLGAGAGPYLVPTIGVDAAGFAGEGSGQWVGYHLGARGLYATRQLGVQAGVAWVRAASARNTLWLFELGLMHVPPLEARSPRATPSAGQF